MKDKEIDIQNRVAKHYEEIRYRKPYSRFYHDWWTSKMLSMVKKECLKGRILDNGCGIGINLTHILEESKEIVGLDISQNMCSRAKKRLSKVVQGDSQRLPFESSYFDLVFARSLLHHLPNPERAVSEIRRVLKPGGEAVFSDTNSSLLSKIPRSIAKGREHFSGGHKNFRAKELLKIIGQNLKIEKITFFGYVAYPLIGFPDTVDFFRYIPFKRFAAICLMFIDQFISLIPVVKKQSWGIMIKAIKVGENLE